MNFQSSEKLFESRAFRYLSRILVLYAFSLIFKSFDLTFIHEVKGFTFRSFLFSLLYVLYGFLVWEGALMLTKTVERRIKNTPALIGLMLLCAILILYGLLISFIFGFFYAVSDILLFNRYEAWESFRVLSYEMNAGTFLFYVMILAFSGMVYYYKRWNEYQIKSERLMRENIQARYEVLTNQIEPHFFFNSLSVLTNLVYKSADLSAEYITRLAKCYRYILDKKFENLIAIEDELEFLESYIFLISVRHRNNITFRIDISADVKTGKMIPPATLQMLVENAIKHNRFSGEDPLCIYIRDEGDCLMVTNNLRKRKLITESTGIGLENIRKRYELARAAKIEVLEDADTFTVKLPIL